MEDELITEEQWRTLPPSSEPLSRFVAFEGIVRRGLNRAVREENGDNYDAVVRMQYMSVVAAAAEELGIPDVRYSGRSNDLNEDLAEFFLAVSRATTKIRLRLESSASPFTVRLAAATRDSIEKQISHLRSLIERSTFPEDQRNAILRRLDELLVDLHEPRFSFARTMTVLGGLSFAIAAGTSFLADAPEALETIKEINRLIWTDQAAENAEIERLGPPPKPLALPAPPKEARVAPRSRSGGYAMTTRDDQDDEIPF